MLRTISNNTLLTPHQASFWLYDYVIPGWVSLAGWLWFFWGQVVWQWDGAASHLLPTPAKTTRPLRVPFLSPLLPFLPLPTPTSYALSVSRPWQRGRGGFSCQQGHLTAKNEKPKDKKKGCVRRKGGQQRNYFCKDQRNSESAKDITPHQPHTHSLLV